MIYRLLTLFAVAAFAWPGARAASLRFNSTEIVRIDADKSTGLTAIYVAPTTSGLVATYTPDGAGADIKWYTYDYRGAAYATLIGKGAEFAAFDGSAGYVVEEGDSRLYFWLADYSATPMTGGELTVAAADCSGVELSFSGSAPEMACYSITGRRLEIDRGISLSYYTLSAGEEAFASATVSRTLPSVGTTISVAPPLCATRFTLSGDRFLRAWGREVVCHSEIFSPVAVEAITSAEQAERTADNEQNDSGGDGAFGGSAPSQLTFSAQVSDAAVFTEWQVATDAEFNNIVLRERALVFEHTFADTGTSYIRFVCANTDGSCEWFGDTYTVSIGESRLRCPNAFSPGASEGINDEWKVSYRSIVQFECHIFNSLGVKMAELRDPSQGWDGKYKGAPVKPGVYYYVIKALGADGKRYNLSGDINIVGSRSH